MKNVKLFFFGAVLLFFSSIVVYRVIESSERERLLKNSTTSPAVLKKIRVNNAPKSGYAGGIFEFEYLGKRITCSIKDDFRMLDLGDTVLIRHSIEDPTVAETVDKFCMKKHRYLKNKE